jgi:hypothetical protein
MTSKRGLKRLAQSSVLSAGSQDKPLFTDNILDLLYSHILNNANSKKFMPKNFLDSAHKPEPVWKQKLRWAARKIQIWFRQLIYSLIEIVILFTATAALTGILLSFLEAFWYLYLQTPVGIKYTMNPSRSSVHMLTQLFRKDLFLFSLEIAAAALAACLIISALCQALAVRRYFYVGRGLLNRVIWLMLFSGAAALQLAHTCQIDLQVALGISIIPNLCLFSSCQNISARLLPELTPSGIWEIIISVKSFLFHPAEKVIPDPNASLYPMGRGNLHPPSAPTASSSVKTPGAERVKPDASGVVSN